MADKEEVKKILEHFRKLDEIDATSYQSGINSEKNLADAIFKIDQLYQQAYLKQMEVQYDKLEALWHSKMEEAVRAEREKIEAIVDNNYREGVVALWDALKTYLKAVKE